MNNHNVCVRSVLAVATLATCCPVRAAVIPWGNSPEQIGIRSGPETETAGPLTFAVSPIGTLFVADSVNGQVKEFGPDGRFQRIVANECHPTSLAFDTEGNLLTLEGHSIAIVGKDGVALRKIQIPESVPLVEGYAQDVFAEGDLVGVADPDQRVHMFGIDDQKPAASRSVLRGRTAPGGGRAMTRILGPTEAAIMATGLTGSTDATAMARIAAGSGEKLGAVLYRGPAGASGLFVEVERIRGAGVGLSVCRVNGGSVTNSLDLPNDYHTTVYKKFEALPDGTVWQMRTTPDGVEFQRMELK